MVTKHQPFIYEKLCRTPKIDGVIFFTIDQFCYENTFNIDLIRKIIELKISIHFAWVNIWYFNLKEVKNDLPQIYSYFYSFNRARRKYARNIKKIL